MKFRECLEQQFRLHPSMQPQDIMKLCYQAAFGAEHLLSDRDAAYEYLEKELRSVEPSGGPLFERISPDYCRIGLAAWKQRGLPPEWLFRMFAFSASSSRSKEDLFLQHVETADALIQSGVLPIPISEWDDYKSRYEADGPHAVHHSQIYRQNEKPSYRVVQAGFIRLFPLLEKLSHLPDRNKAYVIAIDGRSASGKTTLAALLEIVLNAGIIHMDDFFLPLTLRTEDRLAQPGGNVHYERFIEEVLPHLPGTGAFSYRIFNCAVMDLSGERHVPESRWRVVEGAYSCHPAFGEDMDLRVFSDIDAHEQYKRVLARNGEEMARIYAGRWIPLEEAYFQAYRIKERADIVL